MGTMGNEQLFSQFDEIEKKVENLFEKIQSLEAINAQLKETISDLEKGARKKAEEEEKYSEEKALIRSKVDGKTILGSTILIHVF